VRKFMKRQLDGAFAFVDITDTTQRMYRVRFGAWDGSPVWAWMLSLGLES